MTERPASVALAFGLVAIGTTAGTAIGLSTGLPLWVSALAAALVVLAAVHVLVPARPLDSLTSIKAKLGAVIVAAVAATVVTIIIGVRAGAPLWLCGVAAGALSLGMIQFLARGMTSPLREMAAAARAMARGDYGRRVTATSRDEVGELARAFNRMAGELQEVDRMRRDLVANVSHELRTPIAALQVVLENMVDGVHQVDEGSLRTMLLQVERLGRLVAQLLDLSRLESGNVPLRTGWFAVEPLLRQTVQEVRLEADVGTRIEVGVEPADLQAYADAERVHQVVANLLQNALRHSGPNGSVHVTGRHGASGVELAVADDGPGIPPDQRERVFERFYRADPARTGEGGTGLGLSIARWIVELHGGAIRIDPEPRSGCRIVVYLPVPAEAGR